jgi:hypothetical protein
MAVGLAIAEYVAVPLPLLEFPAVIVTHDALLAAVQKQPAGAVTDTEPVPPQEGTDAPGTFTA